MCFTTIKKYTCIYKDQVELIEKNISCSFFLSSRLLPSHYSFIFLKCDLHTVKFLSLVHSSTSFDKHKLVIPSPQSRNETVPSSTKNLSSLTPRLWQLLIWFVCLSVCFLSPQVCLFWLLSLNHNIFEIRSCSCVYQYLISCYG